MAGGEVWVSPSGAPQARAAPPPSLASIALLLLLGLVAAVAGGAVAGVVAGTLGIGGGLTLGAWAGVRAQRRLAMQAVSDEVARRARVAVAAILAGRVAELPPVEVTLDTVPRAWSRQLLGPGTVGCTTGLLERLPDDAELRAVLAHELSHHLRRDGRRRLVTGVPQVAALGYAAVVLVDGVIHGFSIPALALANALLWTAQLVRTANSRRLERRADRGCVELTGDAPALVRALGRLAPGVDVGAAPPGGLLALGSLVLDSHPPVSERVRGLVGAEPAPRPSPDRLSRRAGALVHIAPRRH